MVALNWPERFTFADDGTMPNSHLPLLLYRAAMPHDPAAMERSFAEQGWSNTWRNGIYAYHHFHSIAHEVLGIAAGAASVQFGGAEGPVLRIAAGDVVVIPAGVGHRNATPDANLLVVGAYPGGGACDLCRGDPAEAARVRAAIAAVPLPDADPVVGQGGLVRLWSPPAPH